MTTSLPFTGSYTLDDVEFLLKPIAIENTTVDEKEALIKSGKKHYSQMLTHESLPSAEYLSLFHEALALNSERMARQLFILAEQILATRPHGITLVSLARAGTPVGVLLKHILKKHFHLEVKHYSISIVRDIGIDKNALKYILQHHSPESLVFIDGWTGKGVIAEQLTQSLQDFEQTEGIYIASELYVLTDLSGHASVRASSEDYLMPSSILNATVSGLISRSVYDKSLFKTTDFHGCHYYAQFENYDLSQYFIKEMLTTVARVNHHASDETLIDTLELQEISKRFLQFVSEKYAINDRNYIKPGIGEATRVLLRRNARVLLLKDLNLKATVHLRWLAESKTVPIEINAQLPYQAVALIK